MAEVPVKPINLPDPKATESAIPSTVVKAFYSEDGRLLEPGAKYLYSPKEDNPYPWPILRPDDEKLHEKLEAEYKAFRKEKRDDIADKRDTRKLIDKLHSGR